MTEYRTYSVDLDGHFVGFDALVCTDAAETIEWARVVVDCLLGVKSAILTVVRSLPVYPD
jgi:hypothetical protein